MRNVFIPKGLELLPDAYLRMTLHRYELCYAVLGAIPSGVNDDLPFSLANAIRGIEEELEARGIPVLPRYRRSEIAPNILHVTA